MGQNLGKFQSFEQFSNIVKNGKKAEKSGTFVR